MREQFSSADTVIIALDQEAVILCKSNKPMDRARNGARYFFRNPPQPHMCIQDYIEGYDQLCFINVLSWVKISTPRRPEDPIPLYGGMRVPHSGSTALTVSNNKMPKCQPVIFAVMANPEILRLSGKTAQDPSDRDALVELMIDFVEAMNPDVKFKRQFQVLRDRDLAGELKDIWLAVQVKRERERGENGKRVDNDRGRENREDYVWKEELKHRGMKSEKQEREREEAVVFLPEDYSIREMYDTGDQEMERPLCDDRDQDRAIKHVRLKKKQLEVTQTCNMKSSGETGNDMGEKGTSTAMAVSSQRLTTPSIDTILTDGNQHHGVVHTTEESEYSPNRSWNIKSELGCKKEGKSRKDLIPSEPLKQSLSSSISTHDAESSKQSEDKIPFPLLSKYSGKEQSLLLGKHAETGNSDVMNTAGSIIKLEHDCLMDHNYHKSKTSKTVDKQDDDSPAVVTINDSPLSCAANCINGSENRENIEEGDITSKRYQIITSNFKNTNITATDNDPGSTEDQNILSNYMKESKLDTSEVPNLVNKSHEELLPNVNDNPIVQFAVGTGQDKIVVP